MCKTHYIIHLSGFLALPLCYVVIYVYLRCMKHRIALYLFLVAILCMGCGGNIGMCQLERLETQLDTEPELVLQALDSIPFATLRGEERALYAILKTQADYKCYVPLVSDTLIRHATDYYGKSRKSYRTAMAWYSLGCVYTDLKDGASAVEAYLQAQHLFPDTTIRYYKLCYQNLAEHYLKKKMIDEALIAYSSFRNVASDHDRLYADIGLARAYIYNQQPEQAREILESLLLYSEGIDALSLETILFELGKIAYAFGEYDRADAYFDQLIASFPNQVDATYWFKGSIAEICRNNDAAKHYYKMAMQGHDEVYLQYNCARSLLYLTLDSIAQPELYGYIKRFEQMSDSINHIERRSEIDDIYTAHQIELQRRKLTERHRLFTYYISLAFICTLAIAIIGFLVLEQRRKQYYLRLQRELQCNQAEIYKMYESIEAKRDNGSLTREQLLTLYRANLSASIALFKREHWTNHLLQLSEQRSKDIPTFTIKEREQLAKTIERDFVTTITNLRDEASKNNSKLSAEDIHLCVYMSLGYSTGVIRECLAAATDNVVNQRKKRLANKLPKDMLDLLTNKA